MAKEEPSGQLHLHANIVPDKYIVSGSKGAEVTETPPRHSGARELRLPRHLLDTQGQDYNEAILFAERVKDLLINPWLRQGCLEPDLSCRNTPCVPEEALLWVQVRGLCTQDHGLWVVVGSPPSAIM